MGSILWGKNLFPDKQVLVPLRRGQIYENSRTASPKPFTLKEIIYMEQILFSESWPALICLDEWLTTLCLSVISRQWDGANLCHGTTFTIKKKCPLSAGIQPRTARSAFQGLPQWHSRDESLRWDGRINKNSHLKSESTHRNHYQWTLVSWMYIFLQHTFDLSVSWMMNRVDPYQTKDLDSALYIFNICRYCPITEGNTHPKTLSNDTVFHWKNSKYLH